jgi:hypothetical protein
MAIWNILQTSGIFNDHLVHFANNAGVVFVNSKVVGFASDIAFSQQKMPWCKKTIDI